MDDPPFMPLLTELGGSGDRHCYKHAAPNGAINARARPRHPGYRAESLSGAQAASLCSGLQPSPNNSHQESFKK